MSTQPSRSLPSTSATRRRRILARGARCQLDTGLGRSARRSLPGEWSRTQDQEDDRPTRQWGTTSQDERGRRFAPPCAASEAARRRHTSPPSEARADAEARFARGGRGPAQGPAPARACQEDGSPSRSTSVQAARAHGETRATMAVLLSGSVGPSTSKRFGHAARPPGNRVGRPFALLASGDGCGPRPLGRRRARRERSEPRRQHEPPKEARYDVVAPLPKRRREERSDDRVHPATWCSTVGSACRPPGLGFGPSSGQSALPTSASPMAA